MTGNRLAVTCLTVVGVIAAAGLLSGCVMKTDYDRTVAELGNAREEVKALKAHAVDTQAKLEAANIDVARLSQALADNKSVQAVLSKEISAINEQNSKLLGDASRLRSEKASAAEAANVATAKAKSLEAKLAEAEAATQMLNEQLAAKTALAEQLDGQLKEAHKKVQDLEAAPEPAAPTPITD